MQSTAQVTSNVTLTPAVVLSVVANIEGDDWNGIENMRESLGFAPVGAIAVRDLEASGADWLKVFGIVEAWYTAHYPVSPESIGKVQVAALRGIYDAIVVNALDVADESVLNAISEMQNHVYLAHADAQTWEEMTPTQQETSNAVTAFDSILDGMIAAAEEETSGKDPWSATRAMVSRAMVHAARAGGEELAAKLLSALQSATARKAVV